MMQWLQEHQQYVIEVQQELRKRPRVLRTAGRLERQTNAKSLIPFKKVQILDS